MEIIVEQVTNDSVIDAIMRIRHRVFECEMGIKPAFANPSENGSATYLLARIGPDKEAVGSLCVTDTSDDHVLHKNFGLGFKPQARVARYTHLAVLKPYRGMNIPLAMMIEAHRSVIVPRQFDYTWLLFDVQRAANSFLAARLGFTPLSETFVSEYGHRCPLVRDERAPNARQAILKAEQYLKEFQALVAGADSARVETTALRI